MIKNFENRFKYSEYYITHEKLIQDKIKDIKLKSIEVFDDVLKYVPARYFYFSIKDGYVEAGFESINKKYFTYNQMMTEPSYYVKKWNSNLHSYYGSMSEAKKQVEEKLIECRKECPDQMYLEHYQVYNYDPKFVLLPILHFKSKHHDYLIHTWNVESDVICFFKISKEYHEFDPYERFLCFDSLEISNNKSRHALGMYTEEELNKKNERLNA